MSPATVSQHAGDPPRVVQLLAHPLRWRLLGALVESDRTVRELTSSVDERQSLVSYHLRQLRDGGLVLGRPSAADGRDTYYAVDLAACEAQLQAVGSSLHPALQLLSTPPEVQHHAGRRPRVLFLCTGNSTRSQIAEALVEDRAGGAVVARSAGSRPKPLHPNAVRVMRTRGIDISDRRTKHLDEFLAERFDVVVTLCDRVREVCPEFPSQPRMTHWSIPDPAGAGATDRESYPAFERTAAELETRVRFLLPSLGGRPPSESRTHHQPGRSRRAGR